MYHLAKMHENIINNNPNLSKAAGGKISQANNLQQELDSTPKERCEIAPEKWRLASMASNRLKKKQIFCCLFGYFIGFPVQSDFIK